MDINAGDSNVTGVGLDNHIPASSSSSMPLVPVNTPSSSSNSVENATTGIVTLKEEFLPGSIVRIRMKNFVTYADVEFEPSQSGLNVVMGPNGSYI